MKRHSCIIVIGAAVVLYATGCATGVIGGKPSLASSDKNGTSFVAMATEGQTIEAITNAFSEFVYREMALYKASDEAYLVPGWHPTNGFVLSPLSVLGNIANVPLDRNGKNWVPYVAYFYIVATPMATNQTTVTVRTIIAEVIDGTEFGWHGGTALHHRKVPPIRREEENVLARIETELKASGNKPTGMK